MEEAEIPTEKLQEDIHHHAAGSRVPWISFVAVGTAVLAALAALSSLLAGHHANEAMIEQIQASDQWGYYQAKGVKIAVLSSKLELLTALGHSTDSKDRNQLDKYEKEREAIQGQAVELGQSSKHHLRQHAIFARGVTMFQVAIAVAAISVLVQKKHFGYVCLVLGLLGLLFLLQGILTGA
jgi:hypothetical protein